MTKKAEDMSHHTTCPRFSMFYIDIITNLIKEKKRRYTLQSGGYYWTTRRETLNWVRSAWPLLETV